MCNGLRSWWVSSTYILSILATKNTARQPREPGESLASQQLRPVSEGWLRLRNVLPCFLCWLSLGFGNCRFGKRGGPPSRSSMIPLLHDSQMDDSGKRAATLDTWLDMLMCGLCKWTLQGRTKPWVIGFGKMASNIESFLKRSQQLNNTPLFLTRSEQLPQPCKVSCADLFSHK